MIFKINHFKKERCLDPISDREIAMVFNGNFYNLILYTKTEIIDVDVIRGY